MRVACEFFEARVGQPAPADTKDAEDVARNAIAAAHQKTHMPGSSTVCILTLNADDKFVSAANLGDSGFAVVRNGTVVFQTPALQHFFDCPYQLGSYPDFVDATDYPSDASTFSLNVMPGDVIVMGSDGLWDNLPMQEIVQLLPDTDDAIDASAEVLATVAREHAGALPRTLTPPSSLALHPCAPLMRAREMPPARPAAAVVCDSVAAARMERCAWVGVQRCRRRGAQRADDDEFESPYVQSARDEGLDLPWWRKVLQAKIDDGKLQLGRLTGGKLDDITVLVARVADAPEAAPEAEAEATAVVGQGADVRTPQFDGSTADESIKQNESDGDTRPA